MQNLRNLEQTLRGALVRLFRSSQNFTSCKVRLSLPELSPYDLSLPSLLKPQPVEISFSPADNQRLANLCGALDENLRQIETVLDVTIARRGEHFSLRGKSAQTLLAAEALQNFYSQAQHHLSIEQIQLGLIEAMNPHHSKKLAAATATKEPTEPALITRRSDLRGRTPRQVNICSKSRRMTSRFPSVPREPERPI